ncbi:N-acetyltransferase 8 [Lontra canadensis]|uniref:N-acetyltransferase 8 n=1 Tax=Lontra canadensis TaxID=76717 RepID=UPI0013F2CE1C|nr:N-acetyltransferase 8 [Lontra canadensis]
MAPYHIRKYQESDRTQVLDLFFHALDEYGPASFRHILKLPRTLVLLLGASLGLLLVSGSWLLALIASATLLTALRFLCKYPWTKFTAECLRTDMSDITKSYLSEPGSCFWVAETEGQVVGIVGALPVKERSLHNEQLELLHLCVALDRRRLGIAKALVRTVLQFSRDQGYSQVILTTSMLQHSALALYQRMGFQKLHQFSPLCWRLLAVPLVTFVYCLPSAQASWAHE